MNGAFSYLTRIIPALSLIALVTLLVLSLVVAPYNKNARGGNHDEATRSQLILSVYAVFLHVLSIVFPARVCWAMGDVIKKVKETASSTDKSEKRKSQTVKIGKGKSTTFQVPIFVVIIPAYKEEMETLEETIKVLASHAQARSSYHVCWPPTLAIQWLFLAIAFDN